MSLQSRFFGVHEFACHDGTGYPQEWEDSRLQRLAYVLDVVREMWGGPILVVSGYRTEEYNRRVGGALHSQHVQGRAADVRPVKTRDVRDLHHLVFQLYSEGKLMGLGGLGVYAHWIHVDVREGGDHLAQWSGSRGIGSELV